MTTDIDALKQAGLEGKLQWMGWWRPEHLGQTPPETAWTKVYRHDGDAMIRSYGPDRFRIRPSKPLNQLKEKARQWGLYAIQRANLKPRNEQPC